MSLGIQDLATLVQCAKWLYDNAFDKTNSHERQFRDLGSEVKNLGVNLGELLGVARNIEQRIALLPAHLRNEPHRIKAGDLRGLLDSCADYSATINECARFLRDHAKYGPEQQLWSRKPWLHDVAAPLTNIVWNQTVKTDVVRLKDRLAVHSRKVLENVNTLSIRLLHDLKLAQEDSVRYLVRNQNGHAENIIRRFSAHAGPRQSNGDEDEDDDDDDDDATRFHIPHYTILKKRFNRGLRRSLPDLEDDYWLTLDDGYSALDFHLERWMAKQPQSGRVGYKLYLNLLKTVFLLEKIKASREYELQVRPGDNLAWAQTLSRVEERIASQTRRFSAAAPQASRLEAPPDDDFEDLLGEELMMNFDGDHNGNSRPDGPGSHHVGVPSRVPNISLDSADELFRLPLAASNNSHRQEVALFRQPDLKLVLQLLTTYRKRPVPDMNILNVDLRRVSIKPTWATRSVVSDWSVRFHEGPGNGGGEANLRFQSAGDQNHFQHAMLDYKVGYNGEAKDVELRIWDTSGAGPKDATYEAKFEIWYDDKFMLPRLDSGPSSPTVRLSPTPSHATFPQPGVAQHEAAQSRKSSRRLSILSLPSSISSRRTSASVSSIRSEYSSPISSPDGNVESFVLHKTAEPLLVFFIRNHMHEDGSTAIRHLLAVKFGSAALKLGCNLSTCRKGQYCSHAAISRGKKPLDVMRVKFPSGGDWNVAALGRHQQNGRHVEKPSEVYRVFLEFETNQDRSEFEDRFKKVQRMWIFKNRRALRESRDIKNQEVIDENDDWY